MAASSVPTLFQLGLGAQSGVAIESFESFYRRDYRSLAGLAYTMTGSRWLAEELAQEAMTEAHRRWDKIRTYDDPGAWVRRVMINKKISLGRRRVSEEKAMARLRSQRREDAVEIPEPADEIWAAVRRLPRRQAEAIALFYWEDRPIAEIAEILGLGIETARTHLKRGRAALAKALPNDLAGPQ
jgi:RNA polymerase sigma-70 factor (ECF subfamily)